jgi:hypothetical protein
LVPSQGSDARIKEVWFHEGTVILLSRDVVDALGMPDLQDAPSPPLLVCIYIIDRFGD